MQEILYTDPKTGNEQFLPDGLGEKMGFTRVAGYVPPEVKTTTPPEQTGTTDLSDATDLLLRYIDDRNPNAEVGAQIHRLVDALKAQIFKSTPDSAAAELSHAAAIVFGVASQGAEVVDGDQLKVISMLADSLENYGFARDREFQSGDSFAELMAAIETDDKVSATARERIQKHIGKIQSAATENADPSATGTTEPTDQNQPGKSNGTPADPAQTPE